NSVSFADAQPGSIEQIKPGDQFRAKGQKNADGTEIDATEVVSGSFRNISGTVAAIDATDSTLTVKDLATKKTVTVHITASAQMRRLPDTMARMIAARLKGGATPTSGSTTTPAHAEGGQAASLAANGQAGPGAGARRGSGDMEQVLDRAPVIHLSDL